MLHDLRLDQIVPADWITPTEEGLAFGELTQRQAGQIVRLLEDVAAVQQHEVIRPGPGQGSFFPFGLR